MNITARIVRREDAEGWGTDKKIIYAFWLTFDPSSAPPVKVYVNKETYNKYEVGARFRMVED